MRVLMINDQKAYEAEKKADKHLHSGCLHPLFGMGVAVAIVAVIAVAYLLLAGGFNG